MRRIAIAGIWSAVALSTGAAQKKTIVAVGAVYRYHGDTIWVERDTSVMRTIFHGDTIKKGMWLNDVERSSQTYVAEGDSARLIAAVDRSGRPVPMGASARRHPLEFLTIERRMLETQVRMQGTMASIAATGIMAQFEPPVFADTVRRYAVSSALQIVQYRDTVTYIRGCAGAPQVDTTKFILYNADSLKRVKPERMFGQAMAVSVLTAMRMSMSQERMKVRNAPPTDLPRAPEACR